MIPATSEPRILRGILEEIGVKIPLEILKEETLMRLNAALRSGNPFVVHRFWKELSNNVEKYLDTEKLRAVFEFGNDMSHDILSEPDEKIVEFLVRAPPYSPQEVLHIIKPIHFIIRTLEDLEKFKKENLQIDTLKIHAATSCFLELYETVVSLIDKKLCSYLRHHPKQEEVQRFLNIRRENGNHATVGEVNKMLCLVLGLDRNSSYIFGTQSRCREIRRSFAHAQLSYDSSRKIIIVKNKEISLDDFITECRRLLAFGLKWLKRSIEVEYDSRDYMGTLMGETEKTLKMYSQEFLRIGRSSRAKTWFQTLVKKWERKSQN